MTNLTHQQAHELIQQTHLLEDERQLLREHLQVCDECRAYAAVHVNLVRHLPQAPARLRPDPAQRTAILRASKQPKPSPAIAGPVRSLAGLAAILLLIIASWTLFAGGQLSSAEQPQPVATLRALLGPRPAATPAATEVTPDPGGRYVVEHVPAPSLAGNLIGEPPEQQVAVYLPPSYDTGNRRYPVVYALLFTGGSTPNNTVALLGTTVRTAARLTNQSESAEEMIIVAPNSTNALALPNYFVASPVVGDWQRFLADDLVTYIDANYRTIAQPESRGIVGELNSGWAALQVAADRNDRFSAVYLSDPMFLPPGALEEMGMVSDLVRPAMADLFAKARTWSGSGASGQLAERLAGAPARTALGDAVGYGISFAPSPDGQPPFFEYPYSGTNDQPDPVIWRRWEAGLGEVPQKVERLRDELASLNVGVSTYAGRLSIYGKINRGPAYLSEGLNAAGIDHAYFEIPKDMAVIQELAEKTLPFFSENLAFAPDP